MTNKEIAECRLDEMRVLGELGTYWKDRCEAAEEYMRLEEVRRRTSKSECELFAHVTAAECLRCGPAYLAQEKWQTLVKKYK